MIPALEDQELRDGSKEEFVTNTRIIWLRFYKSRNLRMWDISDSGKNREEGLGIAGPGPNIMKRIRRSSPTPETESGQDVAVVTRTAKIGAVYFLRFVSLEPDNFSEGRGRKALPVSGSPGRTEKNASCVGFSEKSLACANHCSLTRSLEIMRGNLLV